MSCPACFQGAIHEGDPTGSVVRLHGLDTYVAEPADGRPPKGIVVIIPDAFGWEFVNLRLMADRYARKRDYRVYLPEFMNGNAAPLWMIKAMHGIEANETWGDLLAKPYHLICLIYGLVKFAIPNRPGVSLPTVKTWLEALRRNEAAHLPVGISGFCWGGKLTLLLGQNFKADGKPLMDAGFACHPSMVSFYGDIENIRVPISFAVPERDGQFPLDKAAKTKDIIEAKPERERGELKVYYGYGHGFGCRIDAKNQSIEGPDESEDQALAWFDKHFAATSY